MAGGFESAIGHESTAQLISKLLDIDCPANRVQYKQKDGDVALIFKMLGRPPEGKILTEEEIEEIGYSWGIIRKIDKESLEHLKLTLTR